ncbi:MAG TPA: hypothetical protein VMY88_02645 [Acidimicrobiales bacterium]|nr:hypothetical protein [Acidimicrobiales bacterium]
MKVMTATVWGVRIGWLALAFSCGPALGAALNGSDGVIPAVGGMVLWAGWALGLVATLLPSPLSLTLLRAGAPFAALAVAAAAAGAGVDAPVGLAWAIGLTALVMTPAVARYHVNGPAYPNERRHPLRPPGAVLLGPLYLAWVVAVPLPALGALLLAGGDVIGAPVLAAGVAGAFVGGGALLRLAKRWLVFVPAGVVLHDHLALSDPVLFTKQQIKRIGAERDVTAAWDLTLGATGLALEIGLREESNLGKSRRGRGLGQVVKADAVLVSPSRPGAVIAEAEARGLPVQAAGAPPRTN